MAKGTLLYFVSDLHGSSLCFRKFVNATGVYKPTVLVLGGDVAGKAIQSIVKGPNGRWNCTFIGKRYELTEGAELAGKFQAMLLRAPGTRVEGGTDEIMRNIIAERVLGLPGDIRVDKDVPFNKIPTKGRA